MEKRLQMDMQRKLRERQLRLNREQDELQQKLEKQREKIREAEDGASCAVPAAAATTAPTTTTATTLLTNGTVPTRSRTPISLTLPLKSSANSLTTVTSTVQNQSKSASKLPPRPWDYDDYYYQDKDGNWQNEYDDEGYEFDPNVYEDEDEYYGENGVVEEAGKPLSSTKSSLKSSRKSRDDIQMNHRSFRVHRNAHIKQTQC